MNSVGLGKDFRGHCAQYAVALQSCMAYYLPFWWYCDGFRAEHHMCHYRERMHDMKEFEREKRLNRRERLIAEAQAAGKM